MRSVSILAVLVASCQVQFTSAFWSSRKDKSEEATKRASSSDSDSERRVESSPETPVDYGVDVSFPMHHRKVSINYPWLAHNLENGVTTPREYRNMVIQPLGDRQGFYDDFINGCVKYYGKKGQRCVDTERDRVEMSLRQPQSMKNYTKTGYKKIRAPEEVFSLIQEFWRRNKDKRKTESWGTGNTYTNNWKAPTYMVSVEDSKLRGGGYKLKQAIWDAARSTISEWTGQELTQCSLYGIRIYEEGAILATHVDRLPLVSSAIINVDQDLDEPWPLEVIGHDGRAENVTMKPGDMVLYESHSVLHGRPYPLKGRFMANVFIHFEPTGHSLRHHQKSSDPEAEVDALYRNLQDRKYAGHETDATGLPPYIMPDSPEAPRWRASHPNGRKTSVGSFTTGSTEAHAAAQRGDLENLKSHIKKDKKVVNKKDANGWTPLHEGARGGHLDVVKYLIENGADPNATTHGDGATALWWAKKTFGKEHPVIDFLESIGALESGPEL